MATREELELELSNALGSGDKARATALAGEIHALPKVAPEADPGTPDFLRSAKEAVPVLWENAKERMIGAGLGIAQTLTPKSSPSYAKRLEESTDQSLRQQKLTEEGGVPAMVGGALPDVVAGMTPLGWPGAVGKVVEKVPLVGKLLAGGEAVRKAQPIASGATRLIKGFGGGTAASAFEPRAKDQSALAQALVMGTGGAGGEAVQALGGRLVTPFRSTDSKRNAMAKLLDQQGVDVSLAQQTGSPTLQAMDVGLRSVPIIGTSLTVTGSPKQKAQYARAVAKHFGDDELAGTITPDVLEEAHRTLGRKFDAAAAHPGAVLDPELKQAVADAAARSQKYKFNTGEAPADAAIKAQQNRIASTEQVGTPSTIGPTGRTASGKPVIGTIPASPDYKPAQKVTGADYADARSALSKAAAKAARNGDSEEAAILRKLRDANDDWAERNMKNIVGPDGNIDMREMRKQYSNLIDVEKSLDAAGNVKPHTLAKRLERKANPQGPPDDLLELARAGKTILSSVGPDSGTARNLFMAKLLMNPGKTLGVGALAGGAGLYSNPEQMQNAGIGAGSLALATLLSGTKPGRRLVTNSFLNEGFGKTATRHMTSGRLGGSQLAKMLMGERTLKEDEED